MKKSINVRIIAIFCVVIVISLISSTAQDGTIKGISYIIGMFAFMALVLYPTFIIITKWEPSPTLAPFMKVQEKFVWACLIGVVIIGIMIMISFFLDSLK